MILRAVEVEEKWYFLAKNEAGEDEQLVGEKEEGICIRTRNSSTRGTVDETEKMENEKLRIRVNSVRVGGCRLTGGVHGILLRSTMEPGDDNNEQLSSGKFL